MRLIKIIICVFWSFSPSFLLGESFNIVILETMPVPVVEVHSQAIQNELHILSERRNLTFNIEVMKGLGDKGHCINLLNSYREDQKPDFVITIATLATQAAVEVFSETDIPILFCIVMDPVGSGIAKAVGVPTGTNVSGIVLTHQPETKVEMVMRVLDKSYQNRGVKFGFVSTDYPSAIGNLRELNAIAEAYGNIEFISHQFPYEPIPEHLSSLFEKFKEGIREIETEVDFLWEAGGPLAEIKAASQIIIDSDTPVILGNTPASVELGALMSIVTDYQETGLQIAEMVEMILNGNPVGNIPIGVPRKFNLYLNMKTAEEMNIRIPSHMLMIAGDNIHR